MRRPWLLNLILGLLWMGLAKVAFALFPVFLAILASAVLFALLLTVFPFPSKQAMDEDFKRELDESRKSWRDLNKPD